MSGITSFGFLLGLIMLVPCRYLTFSKMMQSLKFLVSAKCKANVAGWVLCAKTLHSNLAEDTDCRTQDDGSAACSYVGNFTRTDDFGVQLKRNTKPFPQKYTEWKWLSIPEAVSLLEHSGKLPSHDSFLCILLKCKKEKSLEHLMRMYKLISDGDVTFDTFGNYFVPAFVECGNILSARHAFDKLQYRNEYSWTSLIQAHVDSGEIELAFELHDKMQSEHVYPNNFTFVALLRACAHLKCIDKGRELHCEVAKEGYEMDQFVGSILVDLYSKCGSLNEAREVFDGLTLRDTVLWTAVIAGYTEHGLADEALKCFQQMQADRVPLDAGTYLCILKACSSLEAVVNGQEIHCEATMKGFEANSFVGNSLVDFYAKCGLLAESQNVFEKLPFQDVVSWNALIAGYSENKLCKQVLYCLELMQKEGRSPNAVTLSCSLKACGSLQAIEGGRDIHSEILKKGYESEGIVGNTLIDMYVKCSLLTEALLVFDNLQARDIVSWNTIFSAYAEVGLGEAAMSFLGRMKSEGVSPNYISFTCSLKACSSEGAIDGGFNLHTDITIHGLEKDTLVGNTLVDMYAKCGWLKESQVAFEELVIHDVVSWNVLIAGYAERRLGKEVLRCYKHMQEEGVSPDALTYVFVLKSCGNPGASEKCQEIHAEVSKDGLELDFQVASSLVVLYTKCGLLLEAREVFDTMSNRDVVSWTALIGGYAEYGCSKVALKYFQRMCLEGVSPNSFTYVSAFKACSRSGDIQAGQALHAEILKKGYEDPFLCSSLVDMYSKRGFLEEAHGLLVQLAARDVVSWTALIAGYAEHGSCEEALVCFEQMQQEGVSPDVISWNAIIFAYAEKGEYEKAFKFYVELQEQGVSPDSRIFVSILKACGDQAALEIGKRIHSIVCRGGPEAREVILMNALIDMYGRCGSMVDARQVFDVMPMDDLSSWNSLSSGYARQGESELVFHLFHKMRQDGIQPDGISFLNLLTGCSHAGLVYEGYNCFVAMIQEYSISPTIKHQTCLIDLFGRAGQLDEAVLAVDKMPFEPDFVVWSAMLSACRKWGDVELGRQSFNSALKSDDKNAGAFIMMYNIYSDAHMWAEAMDIHAMRINTGEWSGTWNNSAISEQMWWDLEGNS